VFKLKVGIMRTLPVQRREAFQPHTSEERCTLYGKFTPSAEWSAPPRKAAPLPERRHKRIGCFKNRMISHAFAREEMPYAFGCVVISKTVAPCIAMCRNTFGILVALSHVGILD